MNPINLRADRRPPSNCQPPSRPPTADRRPPSNCRPPSRPTSGTTLVTTLQNDAGHNRPPTSKQTTDLRVDLWNDSRCFLRVMLRTFYQTWDTQPTYADNKGWHQPGWTPNYDAACTKDNKSSGKMRSRHLF